MRRGALSPCCIGNTPTGNPSQRGRFWIAGVQAHIYLQNVGNVEPNSARYRMFYKLPNDTYRLFRPTDQAHPARKGKMIPAREELPDKYHYLLDWYAQVYLAKGANMPEEDDPILKMRGVGKEIWADVDADEYVRSLRSNWYGDHRDGGDV